MKTLKIFEKGDKILVPGIIADVTVSDTGMHKYRVKDEKSPCTFGTWYTADELVSREEEDEWKTGNMN